MTPEDEGERIHRRALEWECEEIIAEKVAAEREACAKVVEAIRPPIGMHGYNDEAIKHIAAAIRARGESP